MELGSLSTELLLFLFVAAVVGGFIDALAGGGGLITLPALIISGIPPLSALGTNKLQGCMGTATASYLMIHNKRVRWNAVKHLMLAAFGGAAVGTIAVQFVNVEILSSIIPLALLSIAVYFLLAPKLGSKTARPRMSLPMYQKTVVPMIGCYDGMFGPGTGSFFAATGVALRGHELIESTAIAKTLNFATNIASLLVFLVAGQVVWIVGILMMCGQLAGAWLGSHCLFKINPAYLRMIVVVMCLGMLIKYSFSSGWIGSATPAF